MFESEQDLSRLQSCLMLAAQCCWEGRVHKDKMDNVTDATLIRKAARGQGGCGQAIGTHPQREAGVEQVGSPSEQCLRGESVSHLGQGKRLLTFVQLSAPTQTTALLTPTPSARLCDQGSLWDP